MAAAEGPIMIAGIGNPWLGDLDFGPQFARRYRDRSWPDGTELHEAAISPHRVLHLLQDVQPRALALVGTYPRDEPAGTLRTYPLARVSAPAELVQQLLGESVSGVIDFDHTLVVLRHFEICPAETLIVEVEPGDQRFGDSFSDEVELCFERVANCLAEWAAAR